MNTTSQRITPSAISQSLVAGGRQRTLARFATMSLAYCLAVFFCTPGLAATWGPNSNGECDTMINSMTISSDNHNGTANNVGLHSTTSGYNEARPCFHWIGTGVNTALNPNIVTTGGTFTHRITSAYNVNNTAGIGIHILTSPWPANGYSDSNPMVTWVYRDYANQVAWNAQGGDFNSTELVRVNVAATGTYTWTWTGTFNAGYGLIARNRTSTSSINYRKTFAVNTSPRASLTLTYIPPSGEANSCVQNWNVIGTWPDSDTTLATSFLTNSDVRAISEATIAARTTAAYNGQTFTESTQTNDQFNATAYGWPENATGYGFVYVNYSQPDNTNVYIGTGVDERCKVWINSKLVRTYLAGNGTNSTDKDFYGRVTLKSGWNRVLIKAQNSTNDYGWSLRFANADRSALGNCTFAYTDTVPPSNPTGCTNNNEVIGATWQCGSPLFTLTGAIDPETPGEGVSGPRGCYYYWGPDPAGTSEAQAGELADLRPKGTYTGTYYLRVKAYDYALNTTNEWVSLSTNQCDGVPPTGVSMTVGTVTGTTIDVTATGTDADTGVDPATGFNYSCSGLTNSGATSTAYTWTGLTNNVEYSLFVTVSDQSGLSVHNTTASVPQTQWTLSAPPTAGSVTPATTPAYDTPNTWTAVGGFGAGTVQYYRCAFDQSPTHSWTDTETIWSSTNALTTTPSSMGTWYLHVKGYNGAGVANGTYDYEVTAGPKTLTVTGLAAQDKSYDGTTTATLTGTAALSGIVSGDTVSLTGTPAGAFSDANIGTGKTVTISGLSLTGLDMSKYLLPDPTVTASITAASTSTGLISSLNPSGPGSNVTFTATITSTGGTPTGNVVFSANGTPFSTNALASGTASASKADLPEGTNAITAAYAAQGNYAASAGSLDQVVKNLVVLSQTNAILSIVANPDNTATLTFLGTPEAEYYLATSPDAAAVMGSWTPVPASTNIAPAGGIWTLSVSTTNSQRFYRSMATNPGP